MAYLRLDTKNLHLDVLVGACETYKPKKVTREVIKELQELKDKTTDYLTTNWGERELTEYKDLFDKDENALELWTKFLDDEYNPMINNIAKKVKAINIEYQGE